MPSEKVQSAEAFDQALVTNANAMVIVNFYASWYEPCKQMNDVFHQLSKAFASNVFLEVDADIVESLADRFNITSVPAFFFIKAGQTVDSVIGANAPELAKKVEKWSQSSSSNANSSTKNQENIEQRLARLVNYAPVMVFIKGTPDAPQCGFSKQIVMILKEQGVPFSSFNILSDEQVREALKTYSNWPTYPQLYVDGKLVGGLDIVRELAEENELMSAITPALEKSRVQAADSGSAIGQSEEAQPINDRLLKLINQSRVVLFMKGSPDAPKCGFSNKIIGILNENGIRFSSFNILSDEQVRQALKTYSNWPTYPQLYVDGKLVGGLDIVKELAEDGELLSMIPESERL